MRLGEASGPYRAGKMYGGRDGRRGDRPQACIEAVLTEEFVEVVVRTDPDPNDFIAAALPDRPVLSGKADGPHVGVTRQFFEAK